MKKCNNFFTRNKTTKQLAFLIISSTPSLEKYCTHFKPLFLAKSAYFHVFHISTLFIISYYIWVSAQPMYSPIAIVVYIHQDSFHILFYHHKYVKYTQCFRMCYGKNNMHVNSNHLNTFIVLSTLKTIMCVIQA